jgi:hypothetical protein
MYILKKILLACALSTSLLAGNGCGSGASELNGEDEAKTWYLCGLGAGQACVSSLENSAFCDLGVINEYPNVDACEADYRDRRQREAQGEEFDDSVAAADKPLLMCINGESGSPSPSCTTLDKGCADGEIQLGTYSSITLCAGDTEAVSQAWEEEGDLRPGPNSEEAQNGSGAVVVQSVVAMCASFSEDGSSLSLVCGDQALGGWTCDQYASDSTTGGGFGSYQPIGTYNSKRDCEDDMALVFDEASIGSPVEPGPNSNEVTGNGPTSVGEPPDASTDTGGDGTGGLRVECPAWDLGIDDVQVTSQCEVACLYFYEMSNPKNQSEAAQAELRQFIGYNCSILETWGSSYRANCPACQL